MNSELLLDRCIILANKGRGFVKTNPLVGAVITQNNRIVGEGWYQQFGSHHAEINAIQDAQNRYPNIDFSTCQIYVNLEPCCYHGKTPACTDAIIKHRFQQVNIGTLDPNPKISGRGKALLESSGIPVVVSSRMDLFAEHNRVFFTNITQNRPYISLKWAETADGYISKLDTPIAISSSLVNRQMHQLRHAVDGILVGANTVRIDNPNLTTRIPNGENPMRIVLAGKRSISPQAHVFNEEAPTILYGQPTWDNSQIPDHVVIVKNCSSLDVVCKDLFSRNIGHLLVEGGRSILQSFLDQGYWDDVYRIKSNQLLLEEGVPAPRFDMPYSYHHRTKQEDLTYHQLSKVKLNLK